MSAKHLVWCMVVVILVNTCTARPQGINMDGNDGENGEGGLGSLNLRDLSPKNVLNIRADIIQDANFVRPENVDLDLREVAGAPGRGSGGDGISVNSNVPLIGKTTAKIIKDGESNSRGGLGPLNLRDLSPTNVLNVRTQVTQDVNFVRPENEGLDLRGVSSGPAS